PRACHGGWRQDHGRARRSAAVRPRTNGLHRAGVYCLGRPIRRTPLMTAAADLAIRQLLLSRQVLLQRRPALLCFPHEIGGVGREGLPALLAPKQIKPAFRDHPEPRVAGDRDAASHIDRIVSAELRPVNFGMRHKCGAIALVAKTPNGASLGSLEIGLTDHWTGFDEVPDRVETLDCKTGVTVDHHPLCGDGLGRKSPISLPQDTGQHSEHGYSRAKYCSGPGSVSFLPLCRHT